METKSFSDLGISAEVLKAIDQMGFEEATPIQSQTIPLLMQGKDVLAQSPTGTGKTFAFGIPIIESIQSTDGAVQVLILCPTRELVLQTSEELKTLSQFKPGIGIVPIYGGQQIERQMTALRRRPQIIIATPGRMMDHLSRKTISISNLRAVVLDEADEMLNMGFREDIDSILETAPAQKQMILFAATFSREIMEIAGKYLHNAEMVKVSHKELSIPGIEQYYVEARGKAKIDALTLILEHNVYKLSLVFCNTKRMVDELAQNLNARGYSVESIHGDMRQIQRDKVMKQFKSGEVEILVATDVAARGIDVDDIEAVFNYDVPSDVEYYVHRIGRTGRANKKGVAYTFVAGREIGKLHDIMKYTKSPIKLMQVPTTHDITQKNTISLLNTIRHMIEGENLGVYINQIESMIEEDSADSITTLDIAAALLKLASNESKRKPPHVFRIPATEKNGLHKQASGHIRFSESSKLAFNIGRQDHATPRVIVDMLLAKTGIDSKKIGDIDIQDRVSYVMVPKEYASDIIASFSGFEALGKTITVNSIQ